MIVGLARPQMLGRDVRPVPKATDVIFMLDTSPSMFARDMDPHRLGRAEHIIQQFILHKLPDDRYALVGFNYNGVILSYLTREPQTILVYFDYLNRTTEPGVGTNMGAALVSALRVIDADEQITPENREPAPHPGADLRRRRHDRAMGRADRRRRPPAAQALYVRAGHRHGRRVSAAALAARRGHPLRAVCAAASASGPRRRRRRCASSPDAPARVSSAARTTGRSQAAIEEILSSGRPVAGYQSYPIRRDLYFYFFAAAFICMLAAAFL